MSDLKEKYLSHDEASDYLKVREPELDKIVARGDISAYKIGGKYIRYKKDDVIRLKAKLAAKRKGSIFERFEDFLYFNSFYITAGIIAVIMMFVILKF